MTAVSGPGRYDHSAGHEASAARLVGQSLDPALRLVLIGNPQAGQKAGLPTNSATVEDAAAALRRQGLDVEVWHTKRVGHATELARDAIANGAGGVIAAGGDGTVQEVAQALVGTGIPLGIMPLGSVMNLARTLGIPRDLDEAASVIRRGEWVPVDVGEVRGRYFLESAGVGLGSAIFPRLNQLDAGHWPALKTALKILLNYRARPIDLEIDGHREQLDALMVSVANIPYFGAGFTLHPEAQVDDHRFEAKVLPRCSGWELLRFGLRLIRGKGVTPYVRSWRGREITVNSLLPLPVDADTHPIGTTPVTFRVVPGGLHVWAGQRAAETGRLASEPPPTRLRSLQAWMVALRTRGFMLVAASGALAFAALAALVGAGRTVGVDLALARELQSVQHPVVEPLMTAVSVPGYAPWDKLLVLGTGAALWLTGRRLEAGVAVVAGCSAFLAGAIKLLVARPRPGADLIRVARELPEHSFPSGHVMFYVTFFGFLLYLAHAQMRPGRVRTGVKVGLATLMLLVGPSRVYLGHHWPSDTLASYALGLTTLMLLVRVYLRRVLARQSAAPS